MAIETARQRLNDEIYQSFSEDRRTLIEALPSVGKSRGLVEWAAGTGNQLTVLTARHDLFRQYEKWCREEGLSCATLPSFHNDCETANGEHGEDWAKLVEEVYRTKNLLPGEIHRHANKLFGEPLPCQHKGNCSYFAAREFDPEEFDVLVGHYRHAYSPERIQGRYVAFDEFPDEEFFTRFSASQVSTCVRAFLTAHEDLPFEYLRDLREYRHNPERREKGETWFRRNSRNIQRDVSKVLDGDDRAHPDAAAMTYAILVAETLENRWGHARLPDGRRVALNPTDDSLTILNPPALTDAKSIIALDGTPTVVKWKLILGEDLLYRPIMSDIEKGAYLRDTLGIKIIQTTEAANHYSGRKGISVTPEKDGVLFEAVANRENALPAVIASKTALREYEQHGLLEYMGETENYGNLKGSNKFGTTRVGIVSGCENYGFDHLKEWAAFVGESIENAKDKNGNSAKGMNQDFGSLGNQLLRGMRENETLQALMRFGRDAGGATVYVHTAAFPDWVFVSGTVSLIRRWADGMHEVLDVLQNSNCTEWRTRDVSERVSISEQQTRTHLNSLSEFGYLRREQIGRGYTYFDTYLDEVRERGHVSFSM